MTFEKEVKELTGVEPDSWKWCSWESTDDTEVMVFFEHNNQPLSFDVLDTLDDEYGVVDVRHLYGGLFSDHTLAVKLEDIV